MTEIFTYRVSHETLRFWGNLKVVFDLWNDFAGIYIGNKCIYFLKYIKSVSAFKGLKLVFSIWIDQTEFFIHGTLWKYYWINPNHEYLILLIFILFVNVLFLKVSNSCFAIQKYI